MKYKIVVDSSSDLTNDYIKDKNIEDNNNQDGSESVDGVVKVEIKKENFFF